MLSEQIWKRDCDQPALSLGDAGAFDDTHIHAPAVIREDDKWVMYYTGSSGDVANRAFKMGRAVSEDGRVFTRSHDEPLMRLEDSASSILTPTILTHDDGAPDRIDGKLAMWFSMTSFPAGGTRHTIHFASSEDGINWSAPSEPLLEHGYAPTVIRDGDVLHMWYSYVEQDPWPVAYARSEDEGKTWQVQSTEVVRLDQAWEKQRLFYPTVIKQDDKFLMWYGSYWPDGKGDDGEGKTALGFAISDDGVHWTKAANNPVIKPDPSHEWETHYNTCQCMAQQDDGSWRMWFSTRKVPVLLNKYYAIGSAVCERLL